MGICQHRALPEIREYCPQTLFLEVKCVKWYEHFWYETSNWFLETGFLSTPPRHVCGLSHWIWPEQRLWTVPQDSLLSLHSCDRTCVQILVSPSQSWWPHFSCQWLVRGGHVTQSCQWKEILPIFWVRFLFLKRTADDILHWALPRVLSWTKPVWGQANGQVGR